MPSDRGELISTISIWGGQLRGGRLLPVTGGTAIWESLKILKPTPKFILAFEKWPSIKFNFCEISPHPIVLEIACVQTPPPISSGGRGGAMYTGYSGNHEYSSYKSRSLQKRCYFSRFPGKVNKKNKTKKWRLFCRLQMLPMFTTYVTYSRVSKINVYYLRMLHSISVYASKCFVLLSWNQLKWSPR